MGMFDKRAERKKFKQFDGKSFQLFETYFDKRYAKLKGEELKISNDVEYYRVEEEEGDGFILWVH